MDFLKKAVNSAKESTSNSNNNNNNNNNNDKPADGGANQGGQSSQGAQDYVDKAFAFGAKKAGFNIDPATQEKITDGGRAAYEKATGSKVDPKYSN